MASYNPFKLTNDGITLQYKAQEGKELKFTKFKLGDGDFSGNIRDLTDLVSVKHETKVTRLQVTGDTANKKVIIGFDLNNENITEGFYLKEIGLYATDPDTQEEKLVFYTNASDTADYIASKGTSTALEKLFNVELYITDVDNITAEIDSSLTYVTVPEFNQTIENITTDLSNAEADIDELKTDTYRKNETYSKSEIDGKVSSVYRYKGSVANRDALPTKDQKEGDVYNIEDTGMNVAWNGKEWDDLGTTFDPSGLQIQIQAVDKKVEDLKTNVSGNEFIIQKEEPDRECVWGEILQSSKVATGENITINNTIEAPFKKFKISGNSWQETREGYNLFKPTLKNEDTKIISSNCSISLNEDEFSILATGVDAYFGAISSTGHTYTNDKGVKIDVKGKNDLSFLITNNEFNKNYITAFNDENISLGVTEYLNNKGNYHIPLNTSFIIFRIGKADSVSGTTYKTKIMVYEGTEDKPYEQYGASPSPEYPSEIRNCGDNVNKFDGIFRLGGYNSTSSTRIYSTQEIVLDNDYYTLSTNLDMTKYRIAIELLQELPQIGITNTILKTYGWETTNPRTFKIETKGYLGIGISTAGNTNIDLSTVDGVWFKLEKGTKATPYSKYGEGNVNFTTMNKNLFDEKTMPLLKGLWVGAGHKNIALNDSGNYIIMPIIGGETYAISKKNNFLYVCTTENEPKNEVLLIDSWRGLDSVNELTISTSKNAKYLFVGLLANSNPTDQEKADAVEKLMVEEVKKSTPYVPHQSQQILIPTQRPFGKINGYKDTFIKKNNTRYEKHFINRKIFDGSEDETIERQQIASSLPDTYRFVFTQTGARTFTNSSTIDEIYCNKLRAVSADNTWFAIEGINYGSGTAQQIIVYIEETSKMTVEKFREWLSNNNLEIVYQLAEPELIECTEEQSKILDKIENELHSYKDVTIISSDDEIKPNFEVEAEIEY